MYREQVKEGNLCGKYFEPDNDTHRSYDIRAFLLDIIGLHIHISRVPESYESYSSCPMDNLHQRTST